MTTAEVILDEMETLDKESTEITNTILKLI